MLRVMALLVTAAVCAADSAYEDAVAKWREQKEAELKADGGWLTVTGLFWLTEGVTRMDSASGVFALHDGKTIFRGDDGSAVEMKPETKLTLGACTFSVIERAGRYGVRLKDNHSKLREE